MTERSEPFLAAVENRRTYYGISNKSPISDKQIEAIVARAIKHAPNSFNMQQSRAIIVTGENNQKLWATVKEEFAKFDDSEASLSRFEGFKSGYGTVVFFEDGDIIEGWGKNMPAYADAFKIWSENAAGILQYIVWTALEAEGLGASLQHYAVAPTIQAAVTKLYNVPNSWKCSAMLPFGTPIGPPGNPAHPKTFDQIEGKRLYAFFDSPNATA